MHSGERYDYNKFRGRVAEFGFPDHKYARGRGTALILRSFSAPDLALLMEIVMTIGIPVAPGQFSLGLARQLADAGSPPCSGRALSVGLRTHGATIDALLQGGPESHWDRGGELFAVLWHVRRPR